MTFSFDAAACTVTLLAPADGAVLTESPTFDWSGDCADWGLQFSTDPSFTTGTLRRVSGTSATMTDEVWNAHLEGPWSAGAFWRVVGIASDGTTTFSAVRTFDVDPNIDDDLWSVGEGDCNDHDPRIYPGAVEICDGIDQDCDGVTRPELTFKRDPQIVDGSGSGGDSGSGVASDLDMDGDLDIAWTVSFVLFSDSVLWSEHLGAAGFSGDQVVSATTDSPSDLAAGDLDGDGDDDLLVASSGDDTVAWFEYLGTGSFAEHVVSSSLDDAVSARTADLDGDGHLDVLASSRGNDEIVWFQNLGGGSFGGEVSIATAVDSPGSVRATDLDGDGDLDVLASLTFSGTIIWMENLGGALFGPATVAADAPGHFDTADLDSDADEDIVALEAGSHAVSWYENLGAGTFAAGVRINVDALKFLELDENFQAADLDGDADLDVVVGGPGPGFGSVAWYENLGGAVFGARSAITAFAEPRWILTADLDGDFDLDVVVARDSNTGHPPDGIAWFEVEMCE